MSFRTRLSLFFVLIVVVPMVSLTLVLFRLIADSENGKADAGVGARQEVAVRLASQARAAAERGALAIGRDPALATSLQRGRTQEAGRRAQELLRPLGLQRVVIGPEDGLPTVDVGARDAIIPAVRRLEDARGRPFGTLQVSAQRPAAYAAAVARVTGLGVTVRRDGRLLAATPTAAGSARVPMPRGDVEIGGRTFRGTTFGVPDFAGSSGSVSVLASARTTADRVGDARLLAGAILVGFLVLAVAFAVLVSRSLQRQVGGFLDAARRLAGGDFAAQVPTEGNDEFAALGEEFNRMSAELRRREEELRAEQARFAAALRRIGETFAANLDRDGLLEIVLRTALDGTGAQGGRAGLGDTPAGPVRKVAEAGSLAGLEPALWTVEAEALRTGVPAEVELDGVSAVAHPLRTVEGEATVTGVVSIARAGGPFAGVERELFEYLAGQAAVSIENVGLHELVERQAVTDELTGLANRRRFQETLAAEVERSGRSGEPLSLVLLDLDDFKAVNDTHGHLTGDAALRAVAGVLRTCSRGVDTPARYGGEELAMILPATGLDGAHALAERVRRQVEALTLPLPDGEVLRVTASVGVATQPDSADPRELIRAADAALYQAKRTGKNRTVRAAPVPLA